MVDAKGLRGGEAGVELELAESPLHRPSQHESGLEHTSGAAIYVDDMPALPGTLIGFVVVSPHAHARVLSRDGAKARAMPGVHAVLFAEDIPGENQVGPVIRDEPLLAVDRVETVGQSVALVVAESWELARKAAAAVVIEYEELPAIFTIEQAIAAGSFLTDPHTIARGDVEAALAGAALVLEGVVENGGQDHFYLETQVSLVVPGEKNTMRIYCSTQHPSEVQAIVADVMHVRKSDIDVEVPRMGGGFGGKETQAAPFAALAAVAAKKTKRPVKVWLNRDQDMEQTGKRHPFRSLYRAGFTQDAELVALDVQVFSNGGFSNDLSRSICDRALFHSDNAYYLPNVRLVGRACKTNLPSNTAFRGFGGPQGMLVIESVLNAAAERLQLDPALVRARNMYGEAPRDMTPYGQQVERNRLPRMYEELMASAQYAERRLAIETFNRSSRFVKRGIAFQPVKFGISFTASFLNQAGALVHVYSDGTVQMNHGGTEMGQGLHTKMLAVCAHALGVSKDAVRVMTTATDKVPNTSATAASSGSDLNGQAVKAAAEQVRERMRPVAAKLLGTDALEQVCFEDGRVFLRGPAAMTGGSSEKRSVSFAEVATAAYMSQVQLFAAGFYRTPDLHYDRERGFGKPFHYFAFGTAVSEVEVSGLTGEHRIQRVDILHDCGASLVPTIDIGQVEGGFVQGAGWLTSEEVIFNDRGRLVTHSPDTYKIPAIGDVPEDFRVKLLERAPEDDVIYGSKAVGEPPLMLAISVVLALRHAVGAFGAPGREVELAVPATPDAILRAIAKAKASI